MADSLGYEDDFEEQSEHPSEVSVDFFEETIESARIPPSRLGMPRSSNSTIFRSLSSLHDSLTLAHPSVPPTHRTPSRTLGSILPTMHTHQGRLNRVR